MELGTGDVVGADEMVGNEVGMAVVGAAVGTNTRLTSSIAMSLV